MADFDVDSMRLEHESSTDWKIRRSFLLAHHDKFPEDRLLCLASCFVNIEMYGCRYPAGVMAQIKELAFEIQDDLEEVRGKVRKRTQVAFVKATDDSKQSKSSSSSSSTSQVTMNPYPNRTQESVHKPPIGHHMKGMISFVKATSTETSDNNAGTNSFAEPEGPPAKVFKPSEMEPSQSGGCRDEFEYHLEKFMRLAPTLGQYIAKRPHRSPIDHLHNALNELKMVQSTDEDCNQSGYICELAIDGIFVGTGTDRNKKGARGAAYAMAVEVIRKPYLDIVEITPGKKTLVGSDIYIENFRRSVPPVITTLSKRQEKKLAKKAKKDIAQQSQQQLGGPRNWGGGKGGAGTFAKKPPQEVCSDDLSEFVILQHKFLKHSHNAMAILQQSVAFNKANLELDHTAVGGNIHFTVTLQGQLIGKSTGPGVPAAKLGACEAALGMLRKICHTILIKRNEDTCEEGISRNEVVGDASKKTNIIPDSNVGNKLLKKMGWTGGGVGKDGTGISEPIPAEITVIKREGLGSRSGADGQVLNHLRTMVRNYAASGDQNDLAFEPDFDNNERAAIHQEAKKVGLKSQSRGKNEARYLILSRKRNKSELMRHITMSGGSTSKYELVPPPGMAGIPPIN